MLKIRVKFNESRISNIITQKQAQQYFTQRNTTLTPTTTNSPSTRARELTTINAEAVFEEKTRKGKCPHQEWTGKAEIRFKILDYTTANQGCKVTEQHHRGFRN
jgi:hypothetical protein